MYRSALLVFFVFACCQGQLMAQDSHRDAPANVKRSFQRDYPAARNPQWSSSNGQWHAGFNDRSSYDRGEMVAHYDQNGHHIDSHIPYDRNDVPTAVVQRSQSHYPGARDYSYTRIEHPGGQPLFQVNLNQQGRRKTVYMDNNGREKKYDDHH